MIQRSLVGSVLWLALISSTVQSFIARKRHRFRSFERKDTNYRGDPLREATGIRPSVHPLTINILANALKIRARNDNSSIPLYVAAADYAVTPLQVAMAAGQLAADAIQKRQRTSQKDNMSLTIPEQEMVAGRVVGVVMRLPSLESELWIKCSSASWVDKYDEWHTFGVLKQEGTTQDTDSVSALIRDRIQSDPLFVLHRAECLLALFLHQIEAPELARRNATVPDQSAVDFLDADRQQVLFGST